MGQQAGDQGKSMVWFKSQQTQDLGRGKVSAQMQRAVRQAREFSLTGEKVLLEKAACFVQFSNLNANITPKCHHRNL